MKNSRSESNLMIFYPIKSRNDFINNVQKIFKRKYDLCSIEDIFINPSLLRRVKGIYLNWIENTLCLQDVLLIILLKILRKRIIWVFNNSRPHESNHIRMDYLKFYFLANISDYLVILSRNSRKDAERYIWTKKKNKIKYIEHVNYIDTYPVCNVHLRERWKIPQDSILFMFLGFIRPYKNIEIVIKSFVRLNHDKSYLVIAGNPDDATYARQIRKMALQHEHIILDMRLIPNSEMSAYLAAADVMILPYDMSNSINSGALIMNMSYQIPVIISEIAMAKDFNNDVLYKYYYQSKEEHISQLVVEMKTAMGMGSQANKKMGYRASRIMKNKHNESRVFNKLISLLDD